MGKIHIKNLQKENYGLYDKVLFIWKKENKNVEGVLVSSEVMSTSAEKKVSYEVEYRDIKYAKIKVDPTGHVKIIAPYNYEVDKILRDKRDWITQKLWEIEQVKLENPRKDNILLLFGKEVAIDILHTEEDNPKVIEQKNKLIIVTNKKTNEFQLLERMIRNKLKHIIQVYASKYGQILGVKFNKIFIRKQTSKWAGCSRQKNLSFNLLVASVPEEIIQYITIHELTHLIIPRHTRKFWSIVESICPDFLNKEDALRKYWILGVTNPIWRILLRLS